MFFILKVINSSESRPRTANIPVSNIQRLNSNYMQMTMAQKPGTVITQGGTHPSTDNNVRIGQQQQTIRSVILPSNFRSTMVAPRRGIDYRLVLKPVNVQSPANRVSSVKKKNKFLL